MVAYRYFVRALIIAQVSMVSLLALPTTPSVVAGKVEIQQPRSCEMVVRSQSERAIINWKTFSNQMNEIIDLQMPDKTSAILNRVIGTQSSEIIGVLKSNAHVYLINQHGVLFGKHANVRVGELTVSTLDLPDHLFLSGKDFEFTGDSDSTVKNLGQILATEKDICFLGPKIINEGTLTCPKGCASLLAGKKILIQPDQNARMVICIEPASQLDVGAVQAGSIHARCAEILADGNLYSLAIKHTGMTSATRFEKCGGQIKLYAEDGKVEICKSSRFVAHHDDGAGEVQILGRDIALIDQTHIDVSGNNQAGKIFVGGGYRGQDLPRATTVYVGKDVRLFSDAKVTGNGGQIVVWSDGMTRFDGFASVRGGWTSGDGGLIEISGKDLEYYGKIDARAAMGKAGTLLWDPSNVTIGPETSSGVSSSNAGGSVLFSSTQGIAHLNIDELNNSLASANVIISTASDFSYDGDISLTDNITINSSGNNLTWDADGDVNLGFNMTFVDPTDSATFTINTANDFNVTSASSIQFEGNALNCAVGGDANFLADFTYRDASGVNSSTFSLTATGHVSVNGNTTVQNANLFKLESGGHLTINGPLTTINTTTVTLKTNQAYSELLVKSGATITTDADQFVIEGADNVVIQDSITNSTAGDILLTSQQNLLISSTLTPAIVGTVSGDLIATAAGRLSLSGGAIANANAQLGSAATTVNSDITISAGEKILLVGGNSNEKCFALIGHGSLDSDSGSRTGNINITSVGTDITLRGGSAVDAFAQIGHLCGSTMEGAVITGDISDGFYGPVVIPKILLIHGGLGAGAYALFGHGGGSSPSPDAYSGSIHAQAHTVNLYSGTNNQQGAFAAFGYYVDDFTGTGQVTITSPLVELTADFSLAMQSQANANASVGARVITHESSSADITVNQMNVTSTWLAMQCGTNQLSPNEVFLGVFAGEQSSLTASNPNTAAMSNLDITVGQSMKLAVSHVGTNTEVQGLITNGNIGGEGGSTLTCNIGGETLISSGNNRAAIRSIDVLNFASGTATPDRDIVLVAQSNGDAFIDCQNITGASTVSSGNNITLKANQSGQSAFIQVSNATSTQPLEIIADASIDIGASSYIENQGSGDLTLVVDNAFPEAPYRGAGALMLAPTAHIGRYAGGSLRVFTSEREFNIIDGTNNVNGQTFVPGPLFEDSQTERWGVYYPNAFIGSDGYTLFYKNNFK